MKNEDIENNVKCPKCKKIGLVDTHIGGLFLCENCGYMIDKKDIKKEKKKED